MSQITPDVIKQHGLSESEYKLVLEIMGREPNLTELGIFSVMWSEHCSYKSSKKWLKTLPTKAPWVICGPGENAGVIDIGDGLACIFKMESHNHPSFIEPYQGAATGVGGILRDVFTMGARPVANMNALRFGSPDHAKTRHLVSGVVSGIGGYGNCVGVPTVGGECDFHAAYNGNILVNAMTVGLAPADRIFYSAAAGVGNPVVYVGSKTGRDGIHGATMASAEFNEDSEEKRPTVQVGDPFTEKLLIEACMELMATDVIVAIQDMGAAGLTSSSFEMASKGGLGIEMDLDKVPMREVGMSAYEIMLSESQERMLMVLKPGKEDIAKAIFDKWELDFAIVGVLTDTKHMVLKRHGEVVADLPIDPLALASPEYDRPWVEPKLAAPIDAKSVKAVAPLEALKKLLNTPDLCSKRWIYSQYDHMVMGDTVGRPGGDAGVVRVHGANKALAITTDCTPRYCQANPYEGGKQAVAEAWRNLTAVGARPLAVTDNLNFGNPEKPEIMGQIVKAIQGMGEACVALDFPVVSGNVSLYNETNGQAILPTPAIGAVGVIDQLDQRVGIAFEQAGEAVLVIGATAGHLGASIYAREIGGTEAGSAPVVDLAVERKNGDFVRALITSGRVTACHDVSGGGLLVSVAEMAMAGGLGVMLANEPTTLAEHAYWFGEDQARYVLAATTAEAAAILIEAAQAGIPAAMIGTTGGDALRLDAASIPLAELVDAHESWLPNFMSGPESN
ncbi:Phosphoribosylformylglycinamidine synthase 2 [Rhodospirillaceae bacterium LM-1]|nr:Phosphoribosylformylglycinamidine synthase 2 [Rhodospirillaceae bacterium LM-1]